MSLPGRPRRNRELVNRAFLALCIGACAVSVIALVWLLGSIALQGVGRFLDVEREVIDGRAFEVRVDDVEQDRDRATATEREAWRERTRSDVPWLTLPTDALGPAVDQILSVELTIGTTRELAEVRGSEFERDGELYRITSAFRAGDTFTEADIRARANVYAVDDPRFGPLTVEGWSIDEEARGWDRFRRSTGAGRLLTGVPGQGPTHSGIMPAIGGSLLVCAICGLVALPLGVGTAVFLEEFRPRHPLLRRAQGFVELNIRNLAGVPSIVYGFIGLTAFVQLFGIGSPGRPFFELGSETDWFHLQIPFGRSIIAGGLTLMLVVLPIVIIASQEALRAVPGSLREGALAMGAPRWQMVRRMTLPCALPGIMTGSILAMSRAIGETAPLVLLGSAFITWWPKNLGDDFTVLPLVIYNWVDRPQEAYRELGAAAIIVLLVILLLLNGAAILIRHRFQRTLQ